MSWENVKLGGLIDVLSGYAFDSKYFTLDAGKPLIRIRDIKRSFTETYFNSDYDNKFLIKKGDVLIGMDGEFNIVEWKGKDALLNQRVCKVSVKDTNQLDLRYLLHYLPFQLKLVEEKTSFVTVKHLSVKDIQNILIPLPPLHTQKRIADILDAADALRQKDQELLKKYDELAQAIFIEMFGDPVKNEKGWGKVFLKDVTSKIGSGATPTGGKTAYKKSGISLIRSMNIYDFSFKWKDLAFIDESQAERLNNVKVLSKDVLFNITGASVCRCSIVPDEVLPARVNQHVAIIRPKSEILNPVFLNHLLVSNSIKNKLLGLGAYGGAVMEAITKDQLQEFEIIIPPIERQNEFEENINNVFSEKKIKNKSIDISNSLFNSIIQKAFKGELI